VRDHILKCKKIPIYTRKKMNNINLKLTYIFRIVLNRNWGGKVRIMRYKCNCEL